MSKIKTFLTDSQPGYVLKILVNLSLNILIKKVLIKKKSACFVKYCFPVKKAGTLCIYILAGFCSTSASVSNDYSIENVDIAVLLVT